MNSIVRRFFIDFFSSAFFILHLLRLNLRRRRRRRRRRKKKKNMKHHLDDSNFWRVKSFYDWSEANTQIYYRFILLKDGTAFSLCSIQISQAHKNRYTLIDVLFIDTVFFICFHLIFRCSYTNFFLALSTFFFYFCFFLQH